MAQPASNPKIEELRYRLKVDPKSRIFFPLAEELRKVSQLGEAEQVLRAGLANHPSYLSGWVSLGRVLRELGSNEAAIEALKKAIQLDPGNVVAARLLGDAFLAVGQKVEAIKKYKLVLALMPADEELVALIDRLEDELNPIITVIPPRTDAGVAEGAGAEAAALSPAGHPFETALEHVHEPPSKTPFIDTDATGRGLVKQPDTMFPAAEHPAPAHEPTAAAPAGEAAAEPLASHAAEPADEEILFEDTEPYVSHDREVSESRAAEPASEPAVASEPVVHPDPAPLAAVDSVDSHEGESAAAPAAAAEEQGPWVEVTPWSDAEAASPWDEPSPPAVEAAAEPIVAPSDEAVVFAPVHEEQEAVEAHDAHVEHPLVEEIAAGAAKAVAAGEAQHTVDVPFPVEPPPAAPEEDTSSTLTMADLYARQGLTGDARNIYERILKREPENEAVRQKIEALAEADAKRVAGESRRRKVIRLEQWLGRITGSEERRV
ncbi:MAG TPA: tetratricopeptide repeat protein [Thermoanaerobaculia bacterium]|nr:tetratricopeptide repeat protein [Thermoanaerobaculia bacterium]